MIELSKPYIPGPPLNTIVECIYANFGSSAYEQHIVFPTLKQELLISLGDHFELSDKNGHVASKAWISGIQTYPTTVTTGGEHCTIGVLFKPWGLYQAFGLNAGELTNSFKDITRFPGSEFLNIIKERYQDPDICLIIEDLLLKQFKLKKINPIIIPLFGELNTVDFTKTLEATPLNRKSIIHYFHEMVGVTPTQYLHLKKVEQVFEQIRQYPSKKLTEISNEIGFYDQSHFIRYFKKYTGITPKEISKMQKSKTCTILS